MLPIKFYFDWASSFREEHYGYICILPRGGGINQFGIKIFPESYIFSPFAHFMQVLPFKLHFDNFSHSNTWTTFVELDINRSRSSQGHDL